MRGKNLFLFLGIVSALLVMVFFTTLGIKKLNAAPTAPLVVLTNTVLMSWSGGTASDVNYTAGVGTNFGADWIGGNNASVAAGGTISNVTFLTNDGNISAVFIVSAFSNFTGAANTATTTWSAGFTNINDTTGGATLAVTISPAGGKEIRYWVTPPVSELDARVMTFNMFASNSNATFAPGSAINASNYISLSGTNYGGSMGKYGQAFLTLMTNGQASPNMTNWVVTVQAATMTIAKTILIVNPFPFNGNTTTPYPGAKIAYKLAYQNTGAGTANSVTIVDTMPTNYVSLDTVSVTNFTSSAFGGTLANYVAGTGGYPLKTLAMADDDCSTNNAAAEQVVFTPNGTAPGAPGNVASAGSGAYFFSVFLK